MPKNLRKDWLKWTAGLVLGLIGAVTHAHSIYSSTGGRSACSPHGATASTGGSVFSNCARDCWIEGGKWQCTGTWERNIYCATGTACANALCGAGKYVSWGFSASYSITSHGSKGGHSPSVPNYTCN